tara:strand:+ start:78 stop:494 length:417 start_codon:yes stop_codon:yes gene_type:complete
MATRAKIHIARREEGVSFSEVPKKIIVSIYHHFDGYPEYLGVTLASYLEDKKITNGLGKDREHCFNGLGCMAASIVAELKDEPGNVYIEDPNRPHGWIDYEYYIWGTENKDIWISIFEGGECIFVGKPQALINKYDTD